MKAEGLDNYLITRWDNVLEENVWVYCEGADRHQRIGAFLISQVLQERQALQIKNRAWSITANNMLQHGTHTLFKGKQFP